MKKKVFKFISILFTLVLVSVNVAACGSNSKTESTSQTDANQSQNDTETEKEHTDGNVSSEEEITLRFSWWGGDIRHEASLKAIERYMELHPNIKIEAEYQGYDGYYEKMVTTLSSGTAPDLFQFHRDWVADVQGANYYLADLSKLKIDLSTLDAGVLERSGSYDGKPVMFSASVGGQVLYVNTDFFEQHELEQNTTYTWKSLMELGEKIHKENPDEYLMAADVDVLNKLIVVSYIAQLTGGSIINDDYTINFTEEQMRAALQNILDLYETNTLEPFGESAVFVGQMEQNMKWVNGQIGMLVDIGNAVEKYKASVDSVDVLAFPSQDGAVCSGVDYAGNTGFSISDESPNKEAAAEFLDWFVNSEEAAIILGTCRGIPASSAAAEAITANNLLDPIMKKAKEIAAPNSYSINVISGNTELETIRKDVIQEVIYGDITPAEGAEEIVEVYTQIMSGLNK